MERQPAATKFPKEKNSLSDLLQELGVEEMRRLKPSSRILLPSLSLRLGKKKRPHRRCVRRSEDKEKLLKNERCC